MGGTLFRAPRGRIYHEKAGYMAERARLKTLLPLIWFGVVWACASVVNSAGTTIALGSNFYASNIASAAGAVVAGLFIALRAEKLFPLSDRRRPAFVFGIIACACTTLVPLLAQSSSVLASLLAFVLIAAAEASFAYLSCAWLELYAKLNPLHAALCLCVAHGISALLGLAFVEFLGPLPARGFVAGAVLAASLTAYAHCRSYLDDPLFTHSEVTHPEWSFPANPVLLVSIFAFASYYVRCGIVQGVDVFPRLGVVVVCAIMFVLYRFYYERMNLNYVADAALLLAIVALLLRFFPGDTTALTSGVVGSCAYGIFYAFVNAMLCRLSYRYGVNPLLLFGSTYAAIKMAGLLGRVCGDVAFVHNQSAFLVGAAATIVILVAVFLLSASPGALLENWGIEPRGATNRDRQNNDVLSTKESFDTVCSRMAARYGLTRREEEVLGLLAQNTSDAQIEAALCVSRATVRTHIQHVYEKMGVHSKAEVVEVVARELGLIG